MLLTRHITLRSVILTIKSKMFWSMDLDYPSNYVLNSFRKLRKTFTHVVKMRSGISLKESMVLSLRISMTNSKRMQMASYAIGERLKRIISKSSMKNTRKVFLN